MKYLYKIITTLIICSCFLPNLLAEADDYYFNKIPAFSGLSSFYIRKMAQDSTGYIWIATSDGMNRYDGHQIKVYKAFDGKENSGLVSGVIQEILIDSKDRLWVGTPIGMSLYDKENDKFEIIASILENNGLVTFDIKNIYEDFDGNINVATGHHIYKYNEESKNLDIIFTVTRGNISNVLLDDESQGFWVGYNDGEGIEYFSSLEDNQAKYHIPVYHIETQVFRLKKHKGRIWAALGEEGVVVFDAKDKANLVKKFDTKADKAYVNNLKIDDKGNLWVIDFSGIKRFISEKEGFREYYNAPELSYSLQPNIVDFFEDRQGNFYTLHNGEGVYVSLAQVGFKLINTSDRLEYHIHNHNVSAICRDKNGDLWVGSFNGGIDVFKYKEKKVLTIDEYDRNLETGTVTFFYRDSKDNLWTSTYLHGLKKYDYKNEEFITWKSGDSANSIAHNDIRALIEDDKGNLWVGTHGGGIDYFDIEKNTFKNYNQNNNNLTSMWINGLFIDSNKRLWASTSFGVSMLNEGDSIFVQYSSNHGVDIGIKGDDVSCVLEDNRGVIWAGTNEGLYYFSEEKQNFILYDKVPISYITSMELDDINNMWIGTHSGLFRLNLETEIVNMFDDYDGLQGKDFNSRSSFVDEDFQMFFGGTNGLSHFYPRDLIYNETPPKIRFSRFLLFNEPIEKYGGNSILSKEINFVDEVVLDYKENFFTIEFVALNFTNPFKNQYACKLEGFDDDWIDLGSQRSMSYTNLFPGKYKFRVKAANNHGVWNEEGISVVIKINPPWYLSKWFIILSIILFSVLLLLVHKIRVKSLRDKEVLLIDLVHERTLQLKESNEKLQQRADELNNINFVLEERQNTIVSQSEMLKNQARNLHENNLELKQLVETRDRLLSIIAHDLRSPFNTILGFTGLLTDAFDASDPERMKQYARYIHDSSISVFNLLENLLYWARSQTEEIAVKPDYYYLDNIVEETLLLVKESAAKKMLNIDESKYKNHKVYMDVDMMNSVFRNLIINAIKFTPQNGKISIKTELIDDFVQISISDTGVGMSKESIETLFNRLKVSSKPGTFGEKGVGIGLSLSYDFIMKNGGDLKIESILGKGSNFIFTIPTKPLDS